MQDLGGISGELCQKFQCSPDAEPLGSTLSELLRENALRGALDDLGDLLAVLTDDHRVQVPSCIHEMTERTERKIAAAAKAVEYCAFCRDSESSFGTVQGGDGTVNDWIVGTRAIFALEGRSVRTSNLKREGALAGCGTEFVDREPLVNVSSAVESIKPGRRENESVGLALLPLAEAGVDVPAELDEAKIGTQREEHGFAARGRSADARPHGQHVESPVALAHEGIAGVRAGRNRGEGEARIELRGKVLEGVHGDVDAAGGKCILDLLDEDSLSVERRPVLEGCGGTKGRILHPVAGGADDLDRDVVATGAKLVGDVVGLPERELGAARTDAKSRGAHRIQDTRVEGRSSEDEILSRKDNG